jgi:hypothetical protein
MLAHLSQPLPTPEYPEAWPWSGLRRSHRALHIATQAHHQQLRKDGSPFLLHPLGVWQNLMQVELAGPHVLGQAHVELAFYIRHTLAQPAWLGDMPASDALKTRG